MSPRAGRAGRPRPQGTRGRAFLPMDLQSSRQSETRSCLCADVMKFTFRRGTLDPWKTQIWPARVLGALSRSLRALSDPLASTTCLRWTTLSSALGGVLQGVRGHTSSFRSRLVRLSPRNSERRNVGTSRRSVLASRPAPRNVGASPFPVPPRASERRNVETSRRRRLLLWRLRRHDDVERRLLLARSRRPRAEF